MSEVHPFIKMKKHLLLYYKSVIVDVKPREVDVVLECHDH